MRRILIISPHFPPANAPDMQRVRMSLPFYRKAGWEPVVLCVGDEWQDGTREPSLAQTVPSDIRIVRSRALPVRWTRLLGVRNLGLRCWLHFLLAGSRLLRHEKFDLVFFSNTQWVTFTLGRIWRLLHGVPYVFDMQDPWRTDGYSRPGSRPPPGGWKYQFARFSAWALEGWSFGRASGVMSVSPAYITDLRARYSRLEGVPTAVIRFGAARTDFEHARALAPSVHCTKEPDTVNFIYTGAVVAGMPPLLHTLFAALRDYRASNPVAARRLRFHFFGTSYGRPGSQPCVVREIASSYGLGDQITETPDRLGHLECLRLQSEADALLLPGSSDPAYSPSKVYPYFLAGRPILALVHAGSVLADILAELNCALTVTIPPQGDAAATSSRLAGCFDLAVAGFPASRLPTRNLAHFDRTYGVENLALEQGRFFDAALRGAHN